MDFAVGVHFDEDGGDDGGGECEVGVNNRAGHGRLGVGGSGVEGGEVDEHEESSEHRESIGGVTRFVVTVGFVLVTTAREADETDTESKISTEREDRNRSTNVSNTHSVHATFVERVENDFKKTHGKKLGNRNTSENSSEGNENGGGGVVGFDQSSNVQKSRSDTSRSRGGKETSAEQSEEGSESTNDERVTRRGELTVAEVAGEETETDKNHQVNRLEVGETSRVCNGDDRSSR